MEDKRIEFLVRKVFKKAERETVSHSRFALATHIASKTDLSSKTLERAYDKYVSQVNPDYKLQPDSINLLCTYLGFKDFTEYVKETTSQGTTLEETIDVHKKGNNRLWIFAGCLIAIVAIIVLWQSRKNISADNNCMTWADSIYVPVSCDTGPLSTYGTPIVPINPIKLKNFKKVEVDMATQFFSEQTGQPLIWYYTKSKDETEYYTAPGLHPISGKTLKAITEHIIMTRVPTHTFQEDSFLKE